MPEYNSFNLTDSSYIPQFVGLPLDRVKEVGDTLANRHYENIARLRQLELLGHQQAANAESDADKEYINNQISGVQSALAEIAQNGGENATSRVGALATRYMGDEGLINIQKTIDAYSREKALTEKLQAEGQTPVFEDPYRQAFRQRGTYNPETGSWEPYRVTVQPQMNYMAAQDKVVEPLVADAYQTDLMADAASTLKAMNIPVPASMANIPTRLKSTIIETLGKRKVDTFIDRQGGWENYKTTKEYGQQKMRGMDDADIKQELKARGYAKMYERVRKDWEAHPALGLLKGLGAGAEEPFNAGEQLSNVKIETPNPLGDIEDFEHKERTGNLAIGYNPGTQAGTYGSANKFKGYAEGVTPERWKSLSDYAQTGAEVFGSKEDAEKFKNLNEKSDPKLIAQAAALAKQYQEFQKERQIFMQQDVSFTQRENEEGRSTAEDITTDVQDNIRNRAIYDLETGKLIPVIGDDPEEFSDDFQEAIGSPNNIKVTGSLDPKNYIAKKLKNPRFADAYTAIIRDKDDPTKTRRVLITRKEYPEKQQKAKTIFNRGVNEIYATINVEPGRDKKINVFGYEVKGKELIGKQLEEVLPLIPEDKQSQYTMPILATVPGSEQPMLFKSPEHLAEYLIQYKKP